MCSDARFGRVTIPFRGFVFFESCSQSTARFTDISALATRFPAIDLVNASTLVQFVEGHSFGEDIRKLSPGFGNAANIKCFGDALDSTGEALDVWSAKSGDVLIVVFLFIAFGFVFIG